MSRKVISLQQRAVWIQEVLSQYFPHPIPPLQYEDPFAVLIAVVLSAQCTDTRVLQTMEILLKQAPTAHAVAALSYEALLTIIRPCGLGPSKAHALQKIAAYTVVHGSIPMDYTALLELPGVGRKTAQVVLCQVANTPGLAVDTHVARCAQRWGLSQHTQPEKIENDLKNLYPPETWCRLSLQIIYFGRMYCPARQHVVAACPICSQLERVHTE